MSDFLNDILDQESISSDATWGTALSASTALEVMTDVSWNSTEDSVNGTENRGVQSSSGVPTPLTRSETTSIQFSSSLQRTHIQLPRFDFYFFMLGLMKKNTFSSAKFSKRNNTFLIQGRRIVY